MVFSFSRALLEPIIQLQKRRLRRKFLSKSMRMNKTACLMLSRLLAARGEALLGDVLDHAGVFRELPPLPARFLEVRDGLAVAGPGLLVLGLGVGRVLHDLALLGNLAALPEDGDDRSVTAELLHQHLGAAAGVHRELDEVDTDVVLLEERGRHHLETVLVGDGRRPLRGRLLIVPLVRLVRRLVELAAALALRRHRGHLLNAEGRVPLEDGDDLRAHRDDDAPPLVVELGALAPVPQEPLIVPEGVPHVLGVHPDDPLLRRAQRLLADAEHVVLPHGHHAELLSRSFARLGRDWVVVHLRKLVFSCL